MDATTKTANTLQHTPGPWVAEEESDMEIPISAPTRDGMVEIAVISVGFDDEFEAEQHANAHLIAAAPRMFARIEALAAEGDAEALAIVEEVTNGRR